MATSVIPKSEMRRNDNITVGYGELPAIDVEGQTCWGLPGGRFTCARDEAINFASTLDREIRRVMKNPRQLLTLT